MRMKLTYMPHLIAVVIFIALVITSGAVAERQWTSDFSEVGAGVDWRQLDANTLRTIPSSEFLTISRDDLSSIPDAACEGFQADQIEAIPDAVCASGFRVDQLAAIPPMSFRGLKTQCFLSLIQWANIPLRAEQIIQVTPAVLNSLGPLVQRLPLAVFQLMSPQNASVLSGATCQHIESIELGALKPESFGALLDECVDVLPPSAWDGFSPQQAPYFNRLWVQSWDELALAYVKAESFGNLTAAVYASLPPTLCSAISGHQMSKVPPSGFSALTIGCILICESCFDEISADQISALADNTFAVASMYFPKFPPEAYGGIKASQFARMAYGKDWANCGKITGDGLHYLRDEVLELFTQGCWSSLGPIVLSNVTQHMMSVFPEDMYKSMNPYQIRQLSDDVFGNISCSKFQILMRDEVRLPDYPCSAIRPAQLSFVAAECFSVFTRNCARFWTPDHVALLSATQISYTPAFVCGVFTAEFLASMHSNLAGLRAECMQYINSTSLAGLRDDAALFLQAQVWGAMNISHIRNIPTAVFTRIPRDSFSSIAPAALPGIAPEHVYAINPFAFQGFTLNQLTYLQDNRLFLSRLTPTQWSNISAPLFATLRCSEGVNAIPSIAWSLIAKEQFQNVPPEIFRAKDCLGLLFWIGLSAQRNVLQWMTPEQFGAADDVFCSGILPSSVNIPLATWANMTLLCAWSLPPGTIDTLVDYAVLKSFQPDIYDFFISYVCLPSRVVTKMSIVELQMLSPTVLGCMKASTWIDLINANADNVTSFIYDTWSPDAFAGDESDTSNWEVLKFAIANPNDRTRFLAYPPTKLRVNNPPYNRVNVVALSFMTETIDEVDIVYLSGFRGPTIAGLQPALVKRVSSEAISTIQAQQAHWITLDTFFAFDTQKRSHHELGSQLALELTLFISDIPFLSPDVIAAIQPRVLSAILVDQLRAFSNAQFKKISSAQFARFPCDKLKVITDQQLQGISSSQALALDLRARETNCAFETSFTSRSAWTPPMPPPLALTLPNAPAWVYAAFALAAITLAVVVITSIVVYVYIRHAGNPNNQIIQPSARSLFGSRRSTQEDEVIRHDNVVDEDEPDLPRRPLLADHLEGGGGSGAALYASSSSATSTDEDNDDE